VLLAQRLFALKRTKLHQKYDHPEMSFSLVKDRANEVVGSVAIAREVGGKPPKAGAPI